MAKLTLEQLKEEFNKKFALADAKKIASFENEFAISYTYEGLQFEGTNKISLSDCNKLIIGEEKISASEREIKEILNHYGAYEQMLKLASAKKELTSEVLKDLHEILTDQIIAGGVYRNVDIQIPGAPKQPPSHIKVYEKMNHFFEKISSLTNFLEQASYAHLALQKIHPFLDANGRLARLVLNYILVLNGYLPVIFLNKDRMDYFSAIEEYKLEKNTTHFKELLTKVLEARYNDALKFLK